MRRLIAVAALGAGLGLGIGGGVPLDGFALVAEGVAGAVVESAQDPTPAASSAIPSAREFVILDDCTTKEGASVAQGRATNPTADDLAFEIDIFFATDAGTVVGRSRAEVAVAAGETEPWTVSADTQTSDAQCVIGTVNTGKTDATGSSTAGLTGWRLLAAVALAVIAIAASAVAWVRYRKVRGATQLPGAPARGSEESFVPAPDAQGVSVGPRHAKERAKVAEPADGHMGQEPQPVSRDVVEASEQEAQPQARLEVPEWPGPAVEAEVAPAAETEPAASERPAVAPKSRRRRMRGGRSDANTGEQVEPMSADEAAPSAGPAPVDDVATGRPDDDLVVSEEDAAPSAAAAGAEGPRAARWSPVRWRAHRAAADVAAEDATKTDVARTDEEPPVGATAAVAAADGTVADVAKTDAAKPDVAAADVANADVAAADVAKTDVAAADVAKTNVESPANVTTAPAADVAAEAGGPGGHELIGLLGGPADGTATSPDAAMASESTDETDTDWLADLGLDLDLEDMLGLDDILAEPAEPGAGDAKAPPRKSRADEGVVTDRAAAPANDDTDWLAGLFEEDV